MVGPGARRSCCGEKAGGDGDGREGALEVDAEQESADRGGGRAAVHEAVGPEELPELGGGREPGGVVAPVGVLMREPGQDGEAEHAAARAGAGRRPAEGRRVREAERAESCGSSPSVARWAATVELTTGSASSARRSRGARPGAADRCAPGCGRPASPRRATSGSGAPVPAPRAARPPRRRPPPARRALDRQARRNQRRSRTRTRTHGRGRSAVARRGRP